MNIMGGYYILAEDGKTPLWTNDMDVWGKFDRRASQKRETVTVNGEDVDISTVFLGMDHSYVDGGPPILWETMIFGGAHDQYQDRYATYDEAMIGHEKAKRLALQTIDGDFTNEPLSD